MKTSSSITRNQVFGYMILTLILFRVVTGTFGLQFNSIYAEEIYWAITSLIGAVWLISSQKKQGVIAALIGAFALFYTLLFFFCMYFTWLLIGAVDEVKPETFKGIDKKVWLEFHQGSWGREPYETLGIGSSYFGGLMHREDAYLKVNLIDGIPPWFKADDFAIPSGVDVTDCIFWKKKLLLFDMKNKACYKLKLKKRVPLSESENQCIADFKKKWNASVQLEKGVSSIEPLYALSNTIYVLVDFKDHARALSLSNSETETLADEFCTSYITALKPSHSFDSIMVYFRSHEKREMFEFDYDSNYKYARYSIRKNAIVPYKQGKDFIDKVVIPWQEFLVIPYRDGRNSSQEVWNQKLGCQKHHLTDDFKLKKSKNATYKGLNCEVYKAKHPEKLRTPNGYLTCEVTYFIYKDHLVKADVNYLCYPENKKFTYREIVNKVTRQGNNGRKVPAYYKFVSTKYLDFHHDNGDNTQITCHVDTTHIPWKITSMASTINPELVYLYRENL